MNNEYDEIENDDNIDSVEIDEFEAALAAFDDEFEAASGERQYKEVPDGKYNAVIASSKMKLSNKAKRPMWELQFAINGGPCHGSRVFRNQVLDNAIGAKIAKQDVTTMGVEIGSYRNLKKHMADFLDLNVDIQIKTKDDNKNIYINKCHGKHVGDLPTAGGGGGTHDSDPGEIFGEDDMPF